MIKQIKKSLAKATWPYRRGIASLGLRAKALADMKFLRAASVNEPAITAAKRLLICSIGPETSGLVKFLAHYRGIGVDHLLLVDGSGSAETAALLAAQADCSVWTPLIDFKQAAYGTRFYNALLQQYCMGKWTLCVDLDELFVFAYMESRTLQDLIGQLEDSDRTTLWAFTIDVYGPGPVAETDRHSPDLRYFDPSGYYQTYSTCGQILVTGGARSRLIGMRDFEKSSAQTVPLQKIPLLKVTPHTIYKSRQHYVTLAKSNWPHKWHPCPTGVLLTYRYHRQAYDGLVSGLSAASLASHSAVFARMLRDRLTDEPEFSFMEEWSVPFHSSCSLIDHGLLADGTALRPAARFSPTQP